MGGMNLWMYAVGSTVLTAAVISNAFSTKEQFYPAMVYLSKSKPCQLVFGNMGVVLAILLGHLVKRVFLGQLRDIEVEHLTDRIKATITDTLLAMTIFRNEFNGAFVVLFTILLFLKIFHWLSQDRVDFIQHSPASNLGLLRIFSLMGLLLISDGLLLYYAATVTYAKGPSMMLLFGFEALLLIFTIISTMIKFCVNVIDSRQPVQWEKKGSFLLHLEFVTDICQFGVYLVFFAIIMTYYGLPLHIIRNVYLTFNAIKQSVATLYRYKMATANMNERFPEVTSAELNEDNNLCIVCREEMQSAKRLPCGHILHSHCLLNWLQRQQTCPICRMSVLAPPVYAPRPQQAPVQPQQPQPQQPHQAQQGQPEIQPWPRAQVEQVPPQYGLAQQLSPQQQHHNGLSDSGGSSIPAYSDSEAVPMVAGGSPVEVEMLQILQVLQLQVAGLQEQVAYLTEQLQQAGIVGKGSDDLADAEKGKEKDQAHEKEIGSPNVNTNITHHEPEDPAEQLRQRRLLRFSKQD